jgi:hypothetical protein
MKVEGPHSEQCTQFSFRRGVKCDCDEIRYFAETEPWQDAASHCLALRGSVMRMLFALARLYFKYDLSSSSNWPSEFTMTEYDLVLARKRFAEKVC